MQELSLNRRHRSLVWHCDYHSTPGCRSRQIFQGVAPAVATEEGLKNTNGAGKGPLSGSDIKTSITRRISHSASESHRSHLKLINKYMPL